MSVENPRNSYPPLQETVKPIDRVLIASANIIDMLATNRGYRSNSDTPVFDAGWSDDELGCRFELQEHREDGAYHQRRYFLRVYNQFTHGDPRECYRYNSLTKRIDVCDENWKRAKTKQNKHETAELVSRYLQSATDFSETDDQQFISIMAKNNIQDPRLVPRLKRLGGSVVRTILR